MNDETIYLKTDSDGIDWEQVADVLQKSGLSAASAEVQKKAFTGSGLVAFLLDGEKVIGVARALTDGVSQGAIYNVALKEEYQGRGYGRKLIESLVERMQGQNIILYTHQQTVLLYEKLGFRRAKSAMEFFQIDEEHREWLENEGFFLPEGFRFADEYKREDMKGPKWRK
ncbi:MAG: GNAT family N-acetyltransferase [Lachnospiraceae bacterium]|nr:GNAT family N-acetyltransferase [Lachnospiraceae bacterium]